jgi:hypothetical protein
VKDNLSIFNKIRRRYACWSWLLLFILVVAGSSFGQVTFSSTGWKQWSGDGPWGAVLHLSSTSGATATIQDTGTEAFIIHKAGPDCGILQVVVDGNAATMKEVDTYAPAVLWNMKTVVISNLANGPHTITVTVTGRKNSASSDALVQMIDYWTLGRGMWSTERAWAWYKDNPWIVGWNYTPTTCVNATEWWQDETHVSDSSIHRELGIGEQLGYNSIIVYLQYLVWEKDSAYCKERFSHFLELADSHHFKVTPTFFDDVNFVCGSGDDCGNSHLGDQGEPDPGKLMSQWGGSPGPSYVLDANMRPKFKKYVQDFIRTYGQDDRILMWNLYNEPSNSGLGTRTFPLVELAFQWAREIGTSQPLTVSEWTGQNNGWPYNMSDVCSFHGYYGNSGLNAAIRKFRATQRPILCTEWLARGSPGSDILKDLPLFKRLGVGNFCWSVINGRMHCERSWTSYGSYNDPWFHDILYNDGKPYRAEEVDAIRKNLAHKTLNWQAGTTDGALVEKRGCTDPRYAQFDSMATVDDGSCNTELPPLVVKGCLDPESKNYNPLATENDEDMCNATALMQPQQAGQTSRSLGEAVHFIGKNRIGISGEGTIRVELFSMNGRLVWSTAGTGPCTMAIGDRMQNGVYFLRVFRNGVYAGVSPRFTITDKH